MFAEHIKGNIPEPKLNGGLYTGEQFKGPWRNYYVAPDTEYMTSVGLQSANPPPNAQYQFGNIIRPGNNTIHPKKNLYKLSDNHNVVCTRVDVSQPFKSFNPYSDNYLNIESKNA